MPFFAGARRDDIRLGLVPLPLPRLDAVTVFID
jgi:hypothetical protein